MSLMSEQDMTAARSARMALGLWMRRVGRQKLRFESGATRLEKQVRQRDAFFATNEQFHMALLQIAGNRWAMQIVTDLRKVMKLNRHSSLFKEGRIEQSLAEHRAIVQALTLRQPELAAERMSAHFTNGLQAAQ